VDRGLAIELLGRLHEAQGELYAGGATSAVRDLLTKDVTWHVPGENAIAGVYEGIDAVMAYFTRRRDLASGTFRMHAGDVLAGDGPRVAVLTDGTAQRDGEEHHWATVGLYEFRDERIAACWLLPLDPRAFDAIWAS
jgi:hypothetical protein